MTATLSSQQLSHLLEYRSTGKTPEPYKTFHDGMAVWVYPMAFGNGRLCHGYANNRYGYERAWCFRSVEAAFEAADDWDGEGEPEGWKKNLQTQTYRKEYE